MVLRAKALLDENPSPSSKEIKDALSRNYCRCGGYLRVIDAVKTASMRIQGEKISENARFHFFPAQAGDQAATGPIGVSSLKKDGVGKVTGKTLFADDQHFEGMLSGKVLWSSQPHANILSIDKSAAEALPGVSAVLTHKDIPGLNAFGTMMSDQPVLACDKVRSVGDAVAAVFAQDEDTAQRALSLIKVEYQPLEVISDPRRALDPDAPMLHEGGNILNHKSIISGDVEDGFRKADVIVEDDYTTPFIEHAYLEPECGLGLLTEDGSIEIRMATQAPFRDRDQIAVSLDLPLEKVRIVQTPIGGGFGGREDITLQIILALGAYHTKKPVKITLTRQESLRASIKKHAFYMSYKTGATKDGKFLAQQIRILGDTGAYASMGAQVLEQALIFSCGPYVVPNVKCDAMAIYTNNIRCGAMRGFGINQVAFAVESQIDRLAKTLRMDPFQIRLINALDRGERTITGQVMKESVGIKKTIIKAKECLESFPMPKVTGKLGIGVASGYKNVGIGRGTKDSAEAELEVSPNGRVLVKVGTCDMGQGSDTVMAQLAAHALDLEYDSLDVISADTLLAPYGGPTVAQRGTYVTGNAVLVAATKLKEALVKRVSDAFDVEPSRVNFSKGSFTDGQTGKLIIRLTELANLTVTEGEKLTAKVTYTLPKTYPVNTVYQQATYETRKDWRLEASPEDFLRSEEEYKNYNCFSFVTHVAVVEVDESRGAVKVHRVIAAHDCGKLLNPLIALGQIEGSIVMGLGYALSEEFKMNNGLMETQNFGQCHIPGFQQAPEVTTIIIEDPESGASWSQRHLGSRFRANGAGHPECHTRCSGSSHHLVAGEPKQDTSGFTGIEITIYRIKCFLVHCIFLEAKLMIIVGELINASRKAIAAAIEAQDASAIKKLAKEQFEAGAGFIDVNAGVFVDREHEFLRWLVETVQSEVNAPCCLDSPDPGAIEEALKIHKGTAMVNSISLEKARYDSVSLITGTDLKVVALCMSDEGMPDTSDKRLAIADKLINGMVQKGIKISNIFVDPLVQPLATNNTYGIEFLKAVEQIMNRFPGVHTICGMSNISFGLPERKLLNQTFMVMAITRGLDSAVMNPLDKRLMASVIVTEALMGKDNFCMNYLKAYRSKRLEF